MVPCATPSLGEISGGEEILKQLEKANLFVVALDEQGYWYRYHHLFRDFLQARLNKTQPERVVALHRAASEWHAAHGSLREAVQHALKTRDWDYAASLVELHGVSMMLHSEFSTVYEWCAAFPEEVMRVHPSLCLFQGNALVLGYRRQNRGRIEERLQQVEQAAAALEDKQLARLLIGQAAATRTALAALTPDPAVDPREQFALAQRALAWLSEDDPARSAIALTVGYAHMALHDAVAGSKAMEEAEAIVASLSQLFRGCGGHFSPGMSRSQPGAIAPRGTDLPTGAGRHLGNPVPPRSRTARSGVPGHCAGLRTSGAESAGRGGTGSP